MPQIINLVPTTELEAVNAMLAVIGEQPITDVDAAVTAGSPVDVLIAVNILRDQAREVQTLGWKFNTENGYQLMPTGTLSWVDTAGITTLLNVFVPPANLVAYEATERQDQIGLKYIDSTIRRAKYFNPTPTVFPLIFYDRALNREGWDSTLVSQLYINPTWLFNFSDIPEEARRFIYVRASRQFQQQVVGSSELAGFSQQDEAFALRQLKRQHGTKDDYNILANLSVYAKFGRRPFMAVGFVDKRGSPAHS